ncbi:hypothetical protein GALLR39Z86_07150 [Glycomyces algeriensis]|uniref:Uncharacterized protein n=1 Tax=Glycomyces algeriensis TaxID=256037 RepID=A0A9W6G4H4_9ACTN|nr:hypothetical protein GALLR39Z86_07150 [Glycomyces algeriensis]
MRLDFGKRRDGLRGRAEAQRDDGDEPKRSAARCAGRGCRARSLSRVRRARKAPRRITGRLGQARLLQWGMGIGANLIRVPGRA